VGNETFSGRQLLANVLGVQHIWKLVDELLQMREYERVNQLLTEVLLAAGPDVPSLRVDFLTAAKQICLACASCRAEQTYHQEAIEATAEREETLRHQLQLIVTTLARDPIEARQLVPMLQSLHDSEAEMQLDLWQYIRSLFGLKSLQSKGIPAREVSDSKAVAKATPATAVIASTAPFATTANSPTLTVYTFGTFRTYIDDKLIERWSGNISKSLFKYMVLHREGLIPNEVLMDTFWQEAEPESARRNLYQAIYQVRQALQPFQEEFPFILSSNGAYGLNPALTVWLDCEEFEAQYRAGQRWEREGRIAEALIAYEVADSLCDGVFLTDELFADWASAQRRRLQQDHLDILTRLCRYYYGQGQWGICIAYGQRILGEDNCHEETHRQLMLAYYQQGQRHLALRQYHRCVEALRHELEVEPLPETVELYHQLQQNEINFSRPQN
jgi:DNA-binding SARP family transcriptional activator